MIHHNVCPLCSSPEIVHFLSCVDNLATKETFEISRCGRCGFTFTQDYPGESEAGRYYESEDYISHSDSKQGITNKAYQVVRKVMLRSKMKLIRRMTGLSSGKVLDIGSGTGHFLNTMKRSGWEIEGIELSEKAREYSARQFNINTIPPDRIESLNEMSFDCITLWHVMEHFHEPFKYMSEISRLLKTEGTCFIALPNSNSFDSCHYGKNWAAYDVPRHLWHFDNSTFSRFADMSKLSIIKQVPLPFDVFYISILSEKYKGSRLPFMSGIFKGVIFSILSFFNRSRSSSVVYVLKKTR